MRLLSFAPWRLNDIRVAVVRPLDFRGFLADEHEQEFAWPLQLTAYVKGSQH